jgi:hypothetical protein
MTFASPSSATSKISKKSNPKRGKGVWSKFKKFFHHHHHHRRENESEQECRNKLTKQRPTYEELDGEEVILDARESAFYGFDEQGRWRDEWMYHEMDRHNRLELWEAYDPYDLRTSCLLSDLQ